LRSWGWVLVLALLLGGVLGIRALTEPVPRPRGAEAAPSSAEQPNVLLVTLDTVRADRVGTYGGPARTPTLDRLAAQGVRFTNAYAQLPQTVPSHASLFTGQYVSTHGLRVSLRDTLSPAAVTLAEVLARGGYHTAGLYSWYSLDAALSGLDRGFALYRSLIVRAGTRDVTPPGEAAAAWRRGENVTALYDGRADVTTDAAVAWLQDAVRAGAQPFFLWVHYRDPHYPYTPPPPFDALYAPPCAGCVDGSLATLERLWDGWLPTPAEQARILAAYDGELSFVDQELGRLLAALEALGLAPRTLVVVTADHGEAFGEHDDWFHGHTLFQPNIHVPLLLRLPGRLPGGVVVAAAVQLIDILPTVLDLVGLPVPPSVEGRTLLPLVEGREGRERVAVAETADQQYSALVHEGWKLIRDNLSGQRWLYHLATDPGEEHDQAAGAGALADRLEALLEEALANRGAQGHAGGRGAGAVGQAGSGE